MNKLNELKQKIIEAVPSILELKFGCEVINTEYGCNDINKFISSGKDFTYILKQDKEFQEWTHRFKEFYEIIGRPITFEDVLRVIRVEDTRFYFTKDKDGASGIEQICDKWQFGKPLSEQSEETINFLHRIIVK